MREISLLTGCPLHPENIPEPMIALQGMGPSPLIQQVTYMCAASAKHKAESSNSGALVLEEVQQGGGNR
jgi:hypothetical protein